mmetsp:Transcript_47607/g.123366  ORF Transcript_47607/g.123366 Transcript_47607/m.123366 type:complete len:87 (+) Transcript_47607:3786-4046(+)
MRVGIQICGCEEVENTIDEWLQLSSSLPSIVVPPILTSLRYRPLFTCTLVWAGLIPAFFSTTLFSFAPLLAGGRWTGHVQPRSKKA